MQLLDGQIVLSATDLVRFLACGHLTQLDLQVAQGLLDAPVRKDAHLDVLIRKGEAHEARTLARLCVDRTCVHISEHGGSRESLLTAEAETLGAMRDGVDLIYQATFFDGRWRGHADFLLRVTTPSALGAWSYEVADAKLAHSVKAGVGSQLTEYSLHVARLQGLEPALMHVALGDGAWEILPVAEAMEAHIAARRRFQDTVLGPALVTYPDPVNHCYVCRWGDVCAARRYSDGHLSMLAGMRPEHTSLLAAGGISTVADLAAAGDAPPVDLPEIVWDRHRRHARLHLEERTTGHPAYELLPEAEGLGLSNLPPPAAGDLFFDMESEPFGLVGGLEYLFGVIDVVGGQPAYRAFWGHTREEERTAFERLVDFVLDRLEGDPSMHVYHYAAYEVTALRRLAARHDTRGVEVERLVSEGVLVDLHQIVKQAVCISRQSYGLKALEDFYMPRRDDLVSNAGGSMVAYDEWRQSGDPAVLEAIRVYNERDCLSTLLLRDWLEERRAELTRMTA